MVTVRERLKKINIQGSLRYLEPMKFHTTFQIGGPADIFYTPKDLNDFFLLHSFAKAEGIPLFLLGRGANILVSDKGIRGIVVDMKSLTGCTIKDNTITALAGTEIDHLVETALKEGLSGLEFLYGMPGTVGGSVWINARCYGTSISDRLLEVTILDEKDTFTTLSIDPTEFDYKISPFQKRRVPIVSATFSLSHGPREEIEAEMKARVQDRQRKGHYTAPCAGSVFKNCRDFGEPSGKIIDSLGLKGFSLGGAQIAPFHGNIFLNISNSTARDMRSLIQYVQEEVRIKIGFSLEPEILFVGEWD